MKDDSWVDDVCAGFEIEQFVGQLFAPRLASHYVPTDSEAYQRPFRLIERYHVGGFVLFQGEVLGQAALVGELQRASGAPLLFGQDAEWGVGMRLDDATSFPSMAAIAATRNPEHAYRLGLVTAAESVALGVRHVYAPVVDVNNNPANPIINVRSFGEDPELVSEMSTAVIRGLQEGGVLATAKHFPGHGDTDVDSHSDLPVLPFDVKRLESLEWIPFAAAMRAGVDSIMVGHLAMTSIDGPDAGPASLSRRVVTGLLRERLGFDGLIVSDAMDMNGVQHRFDAGEAAVRAIEAGVDLLLTSPDDEKAIRAVRDAIRSGRLRSGVIEASARRVLVAKQRVGLDRSQPPDLAETRRVVGNAPHVAAARAAAVDAVTLLKDTGTLPVANSAAILLVSLNDTEQPTGRANPFAGYLAENSPVGDIEHIELSRSIYAEQLGAVMTAAEGADVVVIASVVAVRSFSGEIGLQADHKRLIAALGEKHPTVLVALGSPYVVVEVVDAVDTVLLGYGHARCVQAACADALRGRQSIAGKLPITLSDQWPFGSGLRDS